MFQKNVWFVKLQPELHKRKGAIGYSVYRGTLRDSNATQTIIHNRTAQGFISLYSTTCQVGRNLPVLNLSGTSEKHLPGCWWLWLSNQPVSVFCSTPQMAKWLEGQQHFILPNKLHNDSDYISIIIYIYTYSYIYIHIILILIIIYHYYCHCYHYYYYMYFTYIYIWCMCIYIYTYAY